MSAEDARSGSRVARLGVALLPLLSWVALLTAYCVLPWHRSPASLLVGVGVMLVGVGLVLAWQVGATSRALFPRLRAIEALTTAVVCFLVVFAGTYVGLSREDPAAFTEVLDRTDGLYFAVSVLATVGFGDSPPSAKPPGSRSWCK